MEPKIGDDTVCVAVGRDIEESKHTLSWALQSFPLKKFCILHVHQRAKSISSMTAVSRPSMVNDIMDRIMDEYLLICREVGVHAEKLHVEDDVARGIVELVHQHKINKLVMGAAADKHYSEGMTYLKSEKALYVEQHVPSYCQIWFICSGHLIHRRPNFEAGPSNAPCHSSSSYLTGSSELVRIEESQCGQDPYVVLLQSGRDLDHLSMPERSSNSQHNSQLELALLEAEKSNQEALEELVKCMKAERTALQAICSQARKLERLYAEELRRRTEAEAEVEKLKQQRDEDKLIALDRKSLLEKISSIMQQLEVSKKEQDDLKVKLEDAKRLTDEILRSHEEETSSIDMEQSFTEFSVSDIKQATNDWDPSMKIGEGTYGSIYKGFLNHTPVAIKVLRPNRSEGNSEFQKEVGILSKLRHPNVVTLIGACPVNTALIYEYLPNGSLEDRLRCMDNSPPLTWKTRIHIATDLCSVLVFLHSSRPCSIVHGNLSPRNILLDANFVCKLSEIGICSALSPLENSSFITNSRCPYLDPEFHTTGRLSPNSDIYSFGIILLRLLTGRSPQNIAQVVLDAINGENLSDLLDSSAGGWPWPYVQAAQLSHLALRCCDINRSRRPDLATEVLHVLEQLRASCAALPSFHAISEENQQPPSYFICPILQDVMREPHVAADGFTYEAEALSEWLSSHDTSPMTNNRLANRKSYPKPSSSFCNSGMVATSSSPLMHSWLHARFLF